MLDKQQISLGAETAEEFWRTFQQGVQAIRLKLSDGTRDDVKSTLLQQVKSDVSNLNECRSILTPLFVVNLYK